MLGAYLHGSAILGGLRPTSDLDVLVVLDRLTTATQRRSLVEGLLEMSGARAHHGPARPVELTVVVEATSGRGAIRPARSSCTVSGCATRTSGAPQPEPAPDLSILITMVLQGNAVLFGPPPAQLLDPCHTTTSFAVRLPAYRIC